MYLHCSKIGHMINECPHRQNQREIEEEGKKIDATLSKAETERKKGS